MANSHIINYQGESGRNYHFNKRGIPPKAFDWVSRSRAAKIQPFVKGEDVVYELGVGSGWNLAQLKCARKIGLDVADFLKDSVTERGIEFHTEFQAVPLHDVDITICHHVLEHLIDPADTLKQLHRALPPKAKLLIYVPFEQGAAYKRFNPDEPNHHLYSWNVQTMGNLVQECGFRVDKAELGSFGYDRFSAAWAVRSGLGESGFLILRKLLHLILPMKEVRIIAHKAENPA